MKRLLLFSLMAVLAVLPLSAAVSPNDESVVRETKIYDLSDFDALDACWMYKVELTQSNTFGVTVEAPDFVMPYLDVRVRNSCLKLDVQDMPRNVRRKLENGKYTILAQVSMPQLSGVEMSGAAKLEADGAFLPAKDVFTLELSGAATLKDLKVSANRCKINCSGASNCKLEGDFGQAKIELSGASNVFINGTVQEVKAELSGASGLEMEGVADKLLIDGSGASHGYFLKCPVQSARIDLSGASKIHLDVTDDLAVRLSGAASCYYRAGDHLNLSSMDVSRGASLKKM